MRTKKRMHKRTRFKGKYTSLSNACVSISNIVIYIKTTTYSFKNLNNTIQIMFPGPRYANLGVWKVSIIPLSIQKLHWKSVLNQYCQLNRV